MMYGSGMGLVWVFPLLVVVGLGVLVWALVRASSSGGTARPSTSGRAADILRERFARGEITEEELRRGLRALDDD